MKRPDANVVSLTRRRKAKQHADMADAIRVRDETVQHIKDLKELRDHIDASITKFENRVLVYNQLIASLDLEAKGK